MYDPLKLCTKDAKGRYIANPGDVIPPTVARIREVLATKWQILLPAELIKMTDNDPSIAAKNIVKEAAEINAAYPWAWDYALNPIKPGMKHPYTRPMALAIAWSWFKRALALKAGKAVSLHITRDEKYKE